MDYGSNVNEPQNPPRNEENHRKTEYCIIWQLARGHNRLRDAAAAAAPPPPSLRTIPQLTLGTNHGVHGTGEGTNKRKLMLNLVKNAIEAISICIRGSFVTFRQCFVIL